MGETAPGGNTLTRILVPFGAGGTDSAVSVGSGSAAATGAGIALVAQTSQNSAPSGAVRTTGTGPSAANTETPRSSWPVTTRRGMEGMRSSAFVSRSGWSDPSSRDQAPVHAQRLAGERRGGVRREERHRGGHVAGY